MVVSIFPSAMIYYFLAKTRASSLQQGLDKIEVFYRQIN